MSGFSPPAEFGGRILAQRRQTMTVGIDVMDEARFFIELIDGLVHEFSLCCVIEYCGDILFRSRPNQAVERGVVFFRTFSLHKSESLFNGFDRVDLPDHFVPSRNCLGRFQPVGDDETSPTVRACESRPVIRLSLSNGRSR